MLNRPAAENEDNHENPWSKELVSGQVILGPPEYDIQVPTIIPKHQVYSTCNLIFWTWDRFPEARYRPSAFIFSSLHSMAATQCWTNAGTLGDSPLQTSARWQPKTGSSEKIKIRNIYNSYKSIMLHRCSLKFSIPQWSSCLYLSLFLTMFPKLQRLYKYLTEGRERVMKWEWHRRKQMKLISKYSSFVWRDWAEPQSMPVRCANQVTITFSPH